MGLLTLMKGLPLAYNRDMQEDKPPLFRTVDTLQACLEITARMLPQIQVKSDRMRQACTRGFLNATDLADYLVVRGVPFRKAHAYTGQAVAYALGQGKELHELSLEELRGFAPGIGPEVFDLLSPEQTIDRRRSYGGTSTDQVEAAIAQARECLDRETATGSS
jgi:argininosuccinate lyase